MEIRRALPVDFAGIFKLAAACHYRNLSSEERQQGFLSAEFTLRQIAHMAGDLGIIVALESGRVVGFMCASGCDWDDQPAVVKGMLAELDRVDLQGRPLKSQRLFVYGPVCIDRAYRGQGLLRAMYRSLGSEVAGMYDGGVSFVAESNPRSLNAHVKGLGMTEVGRFAHEGRSYRILAFPVAGMS